MASPPLLTVAPPLKKGGKSKIPLCLRGNQGDAFDFALTLALALTFTNNKNYRQSLKTLEKLR